ncbi:uncharacterized protein CEXT_194321 [Caerostris extrusa]|uniref:Uncharacterized protein n=1 Tax=Caerostris extrusa TaxID=172846 RepID=A0AAV4MKS7_CAEEX|nr:uncharacterized protein CEXT_194321 [Caerostris extrusa]
MSDTSNLSLNKVNKEIVLNEKENNNCTINEENSKIKSKLSIEEYFNPLLFSENQNINLMNENIPEIVKDSFCANLPLEEDTSKIIDCISLEIPASINQSDFISKKETSSITKECKEIFISSDKFNEHEGKRNCELHSSLHYSNEYEELDCSSTLQHHESKEFTDKNKSYAFECDNIEVPESELEIAEYKIIPAVIELSENKKIPSSSNNSSLDTIEVRPSCSIIEAVMTEINETENKTNCITEVEDTYNIADESSVVEFQLVKENNISIISKDEKKEYANILEETSISENNLNNKQNLESIPALLYTEDVGEKNQNQDEKLTLNEDENNCNENENKRIHSESDKSNKYFEKTIEPQTVDFAKMKIPFLIEHPVTTAPNITFINNSDSIVNGNTNNISEKFPKIHPEEPIEISVRDKMSPRNVTAEISHHVNMTYQQENITSCNKKISVLNETTEDTTVIKKDDEVFKYPMQPITAKIILLTYNSCIAVSVIEQHQQNIYFLKCAFLCDHQEDCLDCFNTLQIGDEVSCFVPPTEISNRIWIAFMVSKDNAEHYSEINKYTNLQKLGENVRNFPNTSVNIQSTSIQVQQSTPKLKKKSIFSCENKSSQTDLSGDIKLRKMIKNSTSQTNLISACTISTQTKMDTVTSTTQTESTDLEIPFHKNNMSQTSLTGNVKNVVEMKSVTCLANFMETKIKNSAECQTFSTGAIMMLDTYPL